MSDGSGSEGETYEVEKILDKKIVKGKTQYFIKWKGELKYFLQILSDQYVNWVQQRENMKMWWFIKLMAAMLFQAFVDLMMWAGVEAEEENTWEPVENLDCEDKIKEFEAKLKKVTSLPSYSPP